jgi:hypothetical protein
MMSGRRTVKLLMILNLGFRHEQIESEGNDPVKTGESFGTPHDLATSQQSGDDGEGDGSFGENKVVHLKVDLKVQVDLKKVVTMERTINPFGRDPLGNKVFQ